MRKIGRTWLYIIFFGPLAFFYVPVKAYLGGGWLFFVVAVAYLCVCSALAYFFGRPD